MSRTLTTARCLPRASPRLSLPTRHHRPLSAKALVYSAHGEPSSVLSLHPHTLSDLPPTHLSLRLLAAPINPADINTIQGTYPTRPPFTTALSTPTPSAVPGNEGLAQVLAAGPLAPGWSPGDWALPRAPGTGTWRTHLHAPAAAFTRLDAPTRHAISPVQAATVSVNPCTAYALLRGYLGGAHIDRAPRPLRPGDAFAQNGANSGVGRAAIQLARAWGFRSINVIRARPEGAAATQALKDELAALGADVVVTEEEAGERGFAAAVGPVQLALNCVGGRSAVTLAKLCAPGASHVTYGAMARQPTSVPAGLLIFRDVRFAGFWVSRWSEVCAEEKAGAVREVLALTREGRFRDARFEEIEWGAETEGATLVEKVQGTLEGYRAGKGVFVFKGT